MLNQRNYKRKFKRNTGHCLQCNRPIPKRKMYCSSECGSMFRAEQAQRYETCVVCGTTFITHLNKRVRCPQCLEQNIKRLLLRNEKERLFKQGLKKCSRCNNIKNLSEFGKCVRIKCGYKGHCKKCECEYILKNIKKDKPKRKVNIRNNTHNHWKQASAFPCAHCRQPAEEWHHFSYGDDWRLHTCPLCCDCHENIRKGAYESI